MSMSDHSWFNVSPIPKGWQCPCCKSVYSPTTTRCERCPSTANVTAVTNGTAAPRYSIGGAMGTGMWHGPVSFKPDNN